MNLYRGITIAILHLRKEAIMSFKQLKLVGVFTFLFILVSGAATVWAQGPPTGTRTSISLSPLYQVETALNERTDFSVQHDFFNLNIYSPVNRSFAWGMNVGYHYQRYDFSGLPIFGVREPWQDIVATQNGENLFVAVAPLAGGATLVTFTSTAPLALGADCAASRTTGQQR